MVFECAQRWGRGLEKVGDKCRNHRPQLYTRESGVRRGWGGRLCGFSNLRILKGSYWRIGLVSALPSFLLRDQLASSSVQVRLRPAEGLQQPIRDGIGEPNDCPAPGLHYQDWTAFGSRIVINPNDLDSTFRRVQREWQIREAARVNPAERCLACRVSSAGGATFDPLDVLLDSIQRNIAHEHAESVFLRKPGLVEGIVLRSVVSSANDVPAAMFE